MEKDWYVTMTGYLGQLRGLSDLYKCPVICAGDVFDDGWRMHRIPPELINFAIAYLPVMHAVPGQHDLPHHSYKDIYKSAYWTLVEAGKIINLEPGKPVGVDSMQLWGFPWGTPVEPCPKPHGIALEVAVVHQYIWRKGKSYEGAPKDAHFSHFHESLVGYHVGLFGDNHIPFQVSTAYGTAVYNSGGFMRRKSDERDYQPTVGLLRSDGTITRYKLDVSEDKFLDSGDIPQSLRDNNIGMESFIEELSALGDAAINFNEAVHRLLEREKVSPAVKRIVLASLEGVN